MTENISTPNRQQTRSMTWKEYAADNPHGYWFKRRWYGWGWVPVKIEGWMSLAAFLALVLWLSLYLGTKGGQPSPGDWWTFYGGEFIGMTLLLTLCFTKGEKPRWSWGRPQVPRTGKQ